MKKLICLLLTVLLLIPIATGCTEGLQGNVTVTVTFIDGSTETVTGHRKNEGDSENSIFTKLSQILTSSNDLVGKQVTYKYANGGIFSSDDLYKLDNGAHIKLVETIENKKYKVCYYASFPGYTDANYYEKTYTFGDVMEETEEITNLTNFDSSLTNFDRYTFNGWEIYHEDANGNKNNIPIELGGTFNEKFVEYFEKTKVQGEYEYQMNVEAYFKPDTYNIVLNFEHDGVKALKTPTAPVSKELNFNETSFNKYDFTKYVKDNSIIFFDWYTDTSFTTKLPSVIDKSLNGKEVNIYAKWSYSKTIKIDFLDGKGPIETLVVEDEFASTYHIYPSVIQKHLTSDQIKCLVGFSDNRDGTSRITNMYVGSNENTIYYPVLV